MSGCNKKAPFVIGWCKIIEKFIARPLVTQIFSLVVVWVDRPFLILTRGCFSPTGFITGWPIVNLTTFGARTGRSRTTPLIGVPDGQNIILIASNFGKSHHPAWYYNLKKKPVATISYKGVSSVYKASEVTGSEWQIYWQMAVDIYPGYQAYAERASRSIPIVVLEPTIDEFQNQIQVRSRRANNHK